MVYNLREVYPEEPEDPEAGPREEEAPRSGRLSRVIAAFLVMGLFAGGLWFAYYQGLRHSGSFAENGNIPLIRADNRPLKAKPENPGGMQVPDRDMLIYGEQRSQVEHLLPPPEQPLPRPLPPAANPPPSPARAAAAVAAPTAPAQVTAPVAPASQPASAASPATAGARPSAAAPGAPASSPAPIAPSTVAAPAHPTSQFASARSALDPIARKLEQLGAIPGENPAKLVRPAPAKGGWRLQLGAVRSEGEAHGEWERLRRRNADLLGAYSAIAVRADLGDRGTYYRVQAGPITDPSMAQRVCNELRQRHIPCLLVH